MKIDIDIRPCSSRHRHCTSVVVVVVVDDDDDDYWDDETAAAAAAAAAAADRDGWRQAGYVRLTCCRYEELWFEKLACSHLHIHVIRH